MSNKTAGEYIQELDERMSKTQNHIDKCKSTLDFASKDDKNLIRSISNNLNNSEVEKVNLYKEICGMIDFEDEFGSDRIIHGGNWERYLPSRHKTPTSNSFIESDSARDCGLEDTDFQSFGD